MANKPSIYKTKVSLQLDNDVIVAIDRKATEDGTSRNAVANYILSDKLQAILDNLTPEELAKIEEMERKNLEARNGK